MNLLRNIHIQRHLFSPLFQYAEQPLTKICEGDLYFYPGLRKVCVGDVEIELTVKEFDALNLLISNRNRILTLETLACQIWGEEYIDITPKTIHNLMSRVRHKLQVSPNTHSYIALRQKQLDINLTPEYKRQN